MHEETSKLVLPEAPKNARIGILGGSFDPPHMGHQLLALCFLALEPIEELWVIPCADHVFHKDLQPFQHRFAMCKLAFSRFNNSVHVLSLEAKLKAPSKTIQTLETIHTLRPDVNIRFAMGSDLVPQFAKWYEPERIVQMCHIVVFERQTFITSTLPPLLKGATVHKDLALPNIKGTDLRHHLRTKREVAINSSLLDLQVRTYIDAHGLYHNGLS